MNVKKMLLMGWLGGGGSPVPPDDWILATGDWRDEGFWEDDDIWID